MKTPNIPNRSRSRVVLSGVHSYRNLENLPSVQNNISRLLQVITDDSICGIDSKACRVVQQPQDPGTLLDALYDAAEACTDTLIFYYAGHGIISPQSGDLALAMPNTDVRRPHSSVRFDDVRLAVLSARRAPRKIVILDCCFSGRAMVGTMSESASLAARSEIEGTYILTAAAETKTALAPPGEKFTAFTGELLRVLEDGLHAGPEFLDLDTIYLELRNRLSARSRPIPQQRNRNSGAKIQLARNKKYRTPIRSERIDLDLVEYMARRIAEKSNPDELRNIMHAVHLPYSKRIEKAGALGYARPEFREECTQALKAIYDAPDVHYLDRIEALGIIARFDPKSVAWIKRQLFGMAQATPDFPDITPMSREKACSALLSLRERKLAADGYDSILGDVKIPLGRRVLTAETSIHDIPERKRSGLDFMWRVARDEKLARVVRLETLRKICSASPEDTHDASFLIHQITNLAKSKDSDIPNKSS